jgi:Flp pilus assembly protein TadD
MDYDDPSSTVLERLEQAERLKLDAKHSDALVILEQLLLEDPENVSALEEVADNELSLGHYERAETAASRAVALDPESYTGEYILGFLRSREERWRESAAHLCKANHLKSNNPEILRCLGWALFNAGERAQGVVTMERALNLDSESTLTLCDLGVAYMHVRHVAKAKALFLRALDIEPGNPRACECVQMLEKLQTMLLQQKAQVSVK